MKPNKIVYKLCIKALNMLKNGDLDSDECEGIMQTIMMGGKVLSGNPPNLAGAPKIDNKKISMAKTKNDIEKLLASQGIEIIPINNLTGKGSAPISNKLGEPTLFSFCEYVFNKYKFENDWR